jgi:hypothetical protein
MSISDALVRLNAGLLGADSVNADVAAARIVNLGSGAGGSATLTSALIPNLTAGSVLFAQQKSSGAAVTPVAAITVASGLGFAVQLVAAGAMAANTNYWIYIAEF